MANRILTIDRQNVTDKLAFSWTHKHEKAKENKDPCKSAGSRTERASLREVTLRLTMAQIPLVVCEV